MTANLTARLVQSVKPRGARVEYVDRVVPGLALRVSPRGVKTWALRYRIGRRLRRWTIGSAPTLSLADAREQARAALRRVPLGHDPALAKQERRDADTFGDVAARYLTEYAQPRKRSWKDDRRLLTSEVLPQWRHRPAREIRRRDAREVIEAVARRGAPILANRLRALLHKLFAFAVAGELVDSNPVTAVPRPGVERQRDRVLREDEIRTLWMALDAQPAEMAAAFKLRLITAQRGGEVVNMRWSDVDVAGGWWTIPAEHSKNKLPHRVPFTPPAIAILEALRARVDEALTARKARGHDDGKAPIYVLAGARGKRQRSAAAATFGIPDFIGHDLRRTAASYMASAGVSRLVISKVLNHVERGVTAVYDRHSYDAEKRTALETWARRLDAILSETPQTGAAVVPIGRRP